ncbi:hypothetical protein DPMN_049703, partial [Dreissena polymorpha]
MKDLNKHKLKICLDELYQAAEVVVVVVAEVVVKNVAIKEVVVEAAAVYIAVVVPVVKWFMGVLEDE